MEQINQLRAKWRPHLGWHGARLSFVAMFLMALFRAKTVNLAMGDKLRGKASRQGGWRHGVPIGVSAISIAISQRLYCLTNGAHVFIDFKRRVLGMKLNPY